MALERDYTMVTIRMTGRDLLRTLAYQRRKPMYEVLEDVIREALDRGQQDTQSREELSYERSLA